MWITSGGSSGTGDIAIKISLANTELRFQPSSFWLLLYWGSADLGYKAAFFSIGIVLKTFKYLLLAQKWSILRRKILLLSCAIFWILNCWLQRVYWINYFLVFPFYSFNINILPTLPTIKAHFKLVIYSTLKISVFENIMVIQELFN